MMLVAYINKHTMLCRTIVFFVCALPSCHLLFEITTGQLGFNPFEKLIGSTGMWSVIILLLTLAITPLRRWLCFFSRKLCLSYGKRLSDWNFLIRSRRMLGLWGFFYTTLHMSIYLYLEAGWSFNYFVEDLFERTFLSIGFVAWVVCLLLALTSPKAVQKKMGKMWRKLHRSMYLLSVLMVLHIWMETKVGEHDGIYYGVCVVVLLGHRVIAVVVRRFYRSDDSGMEHFRASTDRTK